MLDNINGRIAELESEKSSLEVANHNAVATQQERVKQFQELVSKQQTRYHQILGALDELRKMKESYEHNNGSGSDAQPSAPVNRVSRHRGHSGRGGRTDLVHRTVDNESPITQPDQNGDSSSADPSSSDMGNQQPHVT